MDKVITCNSCGGRFEDTLPKCPYCDTMNYKGAEAEYLEELEKLRSDMEELGDYSEEEIKKEIRKQGKFLRRTLICCCVVVAVVLFLFWQKENTDKKNRQADYTWKKENYPLMEEMYEAEQYEKLVLFYEEAVEEDRPVWSWEHAAFCEVLSDIYYVESILQKETKGEVLSSIHYALLLYYGWKLQDISDEDISEVEKDILLSKAKHILEDFETRWNFTEEELELFEKEKEENSGWISVDFCEKYIEKRMKRSMEE